MTTTKRKKTNMFSEKVQTQGVTYFIIQLIYTEIYRKDAVIETAGRSVVTQREGREEEG